MKSKILLFTLAALLASCEEKEGAKTTAQRTVDPLTSPQQIVGTGKIEPQNGIIDLAASAAGIVAAVLKKDGDHVVAGEPLVQLDTQLELIQVQQIKRQIATQENQIEIENADLKVSEVKLTSKNKLLQSTVNLLTSGAVTRQELDDITSERETLKALLAKGRASVKLSEGKLSELYGELQKAETELRKKTLKAPCAGLMLRISARKGAAIVEYDSFAEFAPTGKLTVRAEVDELFSGLLRLGQRVAIRDVGTTRVLSNGEIIQLGPYLRRKSLFSEKPDDQEDRRVREIKVSLTNAGTFIINSKVECIINP